MPLKIALWGRGGVILSTKKNRGLNRLILVKSNHPLYSGSQTSYPGPALLSWVNR